MPLVIGVVGENGAGKDACTKLLAEVIGQERVHSARFSDVLVDTLALWDIPQTRENLQKLPVAMEEAYGKGALTRAVSKRLETIPADVVILQGVRWMSDQAMLRELPNNFLLYVTATPQVRHRRLSKRGEKPDEVGMSYEEFMRREAAPTEVEIPKIGALADYVIRNDESLGFLKKKVRMFCTLRIEPLI